jgi:hypothetical protein
MMGLGTQGVVANAPAANNGTDRALPDDYPAVMLPLIANTGRSLLIAACLTCDRPAPAPPACFDSRGAWNETSGSRIQPVDVVVTGATNPCQSKPCGTL